MEETNFNKWSTVWWFTQKIPGSVPGGKDPPNKTCGVTLCRQSSLLCGSKVKLFERNVPFYKYDFVLVLKCAITALKSSYFIYFFCPWTTEYNNKHEKYTNFNFRFSSPRLKSATTKRKERRKINIFLNGRKTFEYNATLQSYTNYTIVVVMF